MKRKVIVAAACVAVAGAIAAGLALTSGPDSSTAASHREAPLISQDPTADVTDLYAFVSPDKPNTVTLIADWIPFEEPSAGPELVQLLDKRSVRHQHRQHGRRKAGHHVPVQVRQTRQTRSPRGSRSDASRARARPTRLTMITKGKVKMLGRNLPVAPNNIGPRTFPNGSYPGIWRSIDPAGSRGGTGLRRPR